MSNPIDKLTRAKAALVLDQPFFASILLKRELKVDTSIPTAAVDSWGQIYYNPKFIESLPVPEVIWVMAHECMHVMLLHANRRGGRDGRKWNYACDAVINDTLTSSGVGRPAKNTVDIPGSKDKTSEQVYDELPDQGSGKDKGGQGKSTGQGGYDNGLGDEFIEDPNMTEAQQSSVAASIRVDIAEAAQAARMQGKLPAQLKRLVDELLKVKTPWFEILERFMTSVSSQDYSWNRPNRRFTGQGMYLPSMRSEATMGEMVVAIDTSGSVSAKELALFGGHLNRILETCKPEKLITIYCDAKVTKVVEFTPEDFPVTLEAVGGGGTAFEPVFDWVGENGIDPACLVYLTDMYGSFGAEPDYPVLWAAVTDQAAPWGETVRVGE